MTLKHNILDQLKTALKNNEELKVSVLRFLSAKIKDEEINARKREQGLSDDETIAVISRQIKQRKDSIEQFRKGGREDLASREEQELAILQSFIGKGLVDEEIRAKVKEIIACGVSGFGLVMGKAMQELKGKADGSVVKKIVEEELQVSTQ